MNPKLIIRPVSLAILLWGATAFAQNEAGKITEYRPVADRLIKAATATDFAHKRLATLCDTFGPRLSGSTNLEAAIDWVLLQMKDDGLENVHGETVMVPHWVRGEESAELMEPVQQKMTMLGLGGSVATPKEGITAPVLVVRSFDELHQRAGEAKGKIVVFNAPFVSYGQTVAYRSKGAVEAAKVGAVASLVRSITPFSLQMPHTGAMSYEGADGVAKIPHAAITIEDAERLQRWQERGKKPVVRLKMSSRFLPDAKSRNVVAEIKGREKPDEVVVVSGHIDSWDVGNGAQDDGGGCVQAWEVLRLMHQLGLQARRTVRVVLWVNEENGTQGAKTYAKKHQDELPKMTLAIETDSGSFDPTGFSFKGSAAAKSGIEEVASLLDGLKANKVVSGGAGTDVEQLSLGGVPAMELTVENSKYFYYHHTMSDTVDKVKPDELARCAAAMAVMAYVVADRPEGLGR